MENGKKKINVSALINIVLLTVLILVLGFAYMYWKQLNPVQTFQTMLPTTTVDPKYLFAIFGDDNIPMASPNQTFVHQNKIYVADTENNRVQVLDYTGKYLFSIGKKINRSDPKFKPTPETLIFPKSIAVRNNEIYITDLGAFNMKVYDMQGKFLRIFGDKVLEKPSDIFYKNEKFYVIDLRRQQIVILDPTGKEIKRFGEVGNTDGSLYFPNGITVTEHGEIWVADSNNNRIQVFDEQGKVLKVLYGMNEKGTKGGLVIPRGIAVDSEGNIFVANTINRSVVVMNSEGEIIKIVSTGRDDKDEIGIPNSVFLDSNNRLYVTDFDLGKVWVYSL